MFFSRLKVRPSTGNARRSDKPDARDYERMDNELTRFQPKLTQLVGQSKIRWRRIDGLVGDRAVIRRMDIHAWYARISPCNR